MARSMLLVSQLNINAHSSDGFAAKRATIFGLAGESARPTLARFSEASAFACRPMRRGRKWVRNAG